MKNPLKSTVKLLEKNPEVKSYIYQQIAEFDPFVTPQTVVSVHARDPRKLAIQYETEGKEYSKGDLEKLYRIAIQLVEGTSKMEGEGVSDDIFKAIGLAKQNLMQKLVAIQDQVISPQDRLIEINYYLSNRLH
jgi:hypothetical protein